MYIHADKGDNPWKQVVLTIWLNLGGGEIDAI